MAFADHCGKKVSRKGTKKTLKNAVAALRLCAFAREFFQKDVLFVQSWLNRLNQQLRHRCPCTLIVLTLSVAPTFAQTVSEVERRYGKPVSVYSVSEHIWMSPDYSANGQVCRMRLFPRRLGQQMDYLGSQLLFAELTQVLNEMVPPHRRGSKKDGFGLTNLGGGTAWTTYEYENVSFSFIFSYKLDPNVLEKANAKVLTGPDPVGLPLRKKTPPSLDDFAGSENSQTEIVTIRWNHRPCAVK